jgi:hypothetical protein
VLSDNASRNSSSKRPKRDPSLSEPMVLQEPTPCKQQTDKSEQIPVEKEDFSLIRQIVASPDISMHGGTIRNKERVKYYKRIGNISYHCIEEIRADEQETIIVSLWKKKAGP